MLWSCILHAGGCPIRRSTDIALIYSSPWLIAVSRVLRRLLMPRHSPYALLCLNFFFSSYLLLWVSQIIFVTMKKLLSLLSLIFRHFWRLIVVFYPISFSEKPDFKILKKLSVRFNIFIRFSMIFLSPYSIAIRFLSGCSDSLLVGSSGLEPPTSCLSGTRSNLLSYEPI